MQKLEAYGDLTAFEIMLFLKREGKYTNYGFNAQRIGIACMELEREGKVKKNGENERDMTIWALNQPLIFA